MVGISNSRLSSIKDNSSELLKITYAYSAGNITDDIHLLSDRMFTEGELNSAPSNSSDYVPGLGISRWFRLTVTNSAAEPGRVSVLLDNPMADRIEVFEMSENGTPQQILLTGDRQSPQLNPITQFVLPSVDFTLAPAESVELYIYLQTEGAPILPFVILNETDFHAYIDVLHLIWGAFIGIILLMSAYNFVLFHGVRDRTYLLYICYITTMLLELGVVHGYGYYLLPAAVQQWLSDNIISINTIAAYFTIHFALYFLRYSSSDGPLFRRCIIFGYLLLAFATVSLALPEYISVRGFSFLQIATYVLVGFVVFRKLKDNFDWTKYYLYSWAPFFFGAACGFLLFTGQIDYNFYTRHALMFSVMFEMAFISMALADRLGDIEEQRLHQATHDYKLGLPNESLLEKAIRRNAYHPANTGLSLIAVEISNYHEVSPYLSDKQLTQIMNQLGTNFAEQISHSLTLVPLEKTQTGNPYAALIRGDLLSYLVRSNDRVKLSQSLQRLSAIDNYNPALSDIPYRLNCVFGAAVLTNPESNPHELISDTKKAVRLANKKSLPYLLFDPNKFDYGDRRVRLAQDLSIAIDENQLELYHQPQIYFNSPQLRASEVLLRWNHPTMGSISPVEFITIAEETGLVNKLTIWVINQAFRHAEILTEQLSENLSISINISANDLSSGSFFNDLRDCLRLHRVSPGNFTLEVTETAKLTDKHTFNYNMEKLRTLGFKFAIDDFGTGYSSLSYASEHPFTELKIDRAFVSKMISSKKLSSIVSATARLAQEIGLTTTAEGVENKETLVVLKQLGCDKAQGYYIGRPMPFDEYIKWHFASTNQDKGPGESLNTQT
ncbi:EAL domain-containing protein [Reinekea marinisedimentorum]|uniref:EAL domain-containing protein (Putative c-di-GMP-specific phosphodiesterase class I) n=1 Tax=Reinekea marinisedimentorum TaxID=230495 RepID=A0A4R3I7Y0_9GAMM|nr:EAL domain-containing protein [Reinekea marinisedimentorum]TCS41374.1 EAL domain-containing protein (putative c-di-GMP-specific phosphodiesterase class I) [Reinekea marinisedimentorum]